MLLATTTGCTVGFGARVARASRRHPHGETDMGTSTTANNMGNGSNLQGTIDTMADQAQGAAAGVRETVDRVADSASDAASRLGDRAQDAIEQVSDTASEYASRFAETRDRLMEDARDTITAYPLRTIGIAALTGYVLGRMMR
jgi:ElaB/YqjD/DUF883 family membrane-anchored ribosome-binding protein